MRTNFGRLIVWPCWATTQYCNGLGRPSYVKKLSESKIDDENADDLDQMFGRIDLDLEYEADCFRPVEPFKDLSVIDTFAEDGRKLDIAKTAFGHKYFFAITTDGLLYQLRIGRDKQWRRVAGTEQIEDPIVHCDSGSAHSVLVTATRDCYTWGSSAFGMLGIGPCADAVVKTPRLVESLKGRVVSAGAGGYRSWTGAFSLFLLENNEIYFAGRLGARSGVAIPEKVDCEDLSGRHILSIACGEDWAAVVASAKKSEILE